jgi:hypothetical protein
MFRRFLILAAVLCVGCSQLFAERVDTIRKPQSAVRGKKPVLGLGPVNAILTPPSYHSGFFSALFTVIGFVQECERAAWEGYVVDFSDQGNFYEPSMGPNWWTYYFEPICKVPTSASSDRPLAEEQKMQFGLDVTFQDRNEVNSFIQKYIHVNQTVQSVLEGEIAQYFDGTPVIGVSYVRPDRVLVRSSGGFLHFFNAIDKLLREEDSKIFVSTDDDDFLQQMIARYGSKVMYRDVPRYVDGVKTAYQSLEPNFDRGLDEIIECLLLAECTAIVRTNSHMSIAASLFNPELKFITVRQLRSNN